MFDFVSTIKGIVSPVTDLIDSMHTSDEEKIEARRKLAKVENEITSEMLTLVKAQMEARAQIITAEAEGDSFLQRSWRPITMLTFLVMLVTYWFGLVPNEVAQSLNDQQVLGDVFGLLKIGIGGYIGGRTIEKVNRDGDKVKKMIDKFLPTKESPTQNETASDDPTNDSNEMVAW